MPSRDRYDIPFQMLRMSCSLRISDREFTTHMIGSAYLETCYELVIRAYISIFALTSQGCLRLSHALDSRVGLCKQMLALDRRLFD